MPGTEGEADDEAVAEAANAGISLRIILNT